MADFLIFSLCVCVLVWNWTDFNIDNIVIFCLAFSQSLFQWCAKRLHEIKFKLRTFQVAFEWNGVLVNSQWWCVATQRLTHTEDRVEIDRAFKCECENKMQMANLYFKWLYFWRHICILIDLYTEWFCEVQFLCFLLLLVDCRL